MTQSEQGGRRRGVLLGFTMPDEVAKELIAADPNPPHQTHNFSRALLAALRGAGFEMDLVSAWPMSNYPAGGRLILPARRFRLDGELTGQFLPFVNLPLLKHLTRLLALTTPLARRLRDQRAEVVFVHGVHSSYLFYAAWLKRRHGKRIVAVLTDPPGVELPGESLAIRKLKALDRKLVRKLLKSFDAAICLSPSLSESLVFSETPSLILEGFIAADLEHFEKKQRAPIPTIVYAGGLHSEYGAETLARAVRLMRTPDLRASFFGRGNAESVISALSDEDERIAKPQMLNRGELLAVYERAWLLVQPRPVTTAQARESFPSKLIEYLATGVPVASTRLTGIPDDYEGYFYPLPDSDAGAMAASLDRILEEIAGDGIDRGDRARAFMRSTRSIEAQSAKIRQFLNAALS